jgi:hypothetical protein
MTCIINNKFQHVNNYVDQLILNTLEVNLKSFFDYALLSIGAWTDVSFNNNTIYNTISPDRLVSIKDPSYPDGCVWQSFRKDWLWERDSFFGSSPIANPIIKVNNSIVNNGFYIDYPNGRVVFNNAISGNSNVTAAYSYRNIQTYRSSDAPWWQLLQYGSLQPSEVVNQSGSWTIGSHHRIQMPCIVIDSVPRSRNLPHELGSKSLIVEQDIIFNVMAETKNDRNQILDIIRLQQDNTIWLYDLNKAAREDKLPLNYLGNKNLNGLNYQNMINEYKWAKTFFKNILLSEVQSINVGLYEGLARATFEIIFDGFTD